MRAARTWASGLFLGALGCGPAAAPTTAPEASDRRAPSGERSAAQCRSQTSQWVARVHELRDAGRLEDALSASRPKLDGCASAETELADARLRVLQELKDQRGIHETALWLSQANDASPLAREHAKQALSQAGAPIDDLRLARDATTRGLQLTWDQRRAALDTALLAYERATGERAEAVALSPSNNLQVLDEGTLVALARPTPGRGFQPVVLDLVGEQGKVPVGTARRVLPATAGEVPRISVAPSGLIVTSAGGNGFVYASPSSAGRPLPKAATHQALSGDRVVVANPDWVLVVAGNTGGEVLSKTRVSVSSAALTRARRSRDRKFWVACAAAGEEPSGVVALAAPSGVLAVNLPPVAGCAFDDKRSKLAVLHSTRPAVLEIFDLSAGTSSRVQLPKLGAPGETRLGITSSEPAAVSVSTDDKHVFVNLASGRMTTRLPASRPVGPPALRSVSVGSAGETPSSVRGLERLAVAPRRVIRPAFATLQAWTANGVMSFDGKTVAAYTSDPKSGGIELVVADAASLKVRHRIALEYGENWLTAFFIDNRLLVAQSYPNHQVFDANTGEYLASIENQEPELHFDRFLLEAGVLWDTSPNVKAESRKLDLGFVDDGEWTGKPEPRTWQVKGKPGRLTFADDGGVQLEGMDAPRWLYCRFGEWLAPWPVCEHRLQR